MKRFTAPFLVLGTLALSSCSGEKPGGDAHPAASGASAEPLSSSAAPSGAVSAGGPAAVASAAAAPPIGAPPACKISGQKVWGQGANKVTGLTDVDLPDGRVAIGLALGNEPHVLVIGKGGVGKLTRVVPKEGTDLAKKIAPADGARSVMRVTPVKVDGTHVEAFVDYHDDYKDKRRHVACGPADGDAAWINFDGVPLLDRAEQPTGAERARLFKSSDADGDTGYHELRDCRTFADPAKNETWIVGSELRATDKADGTVEWKSSLVIDRGPKVHEVHLHELDLKGAPPHLINFEVPMLHPLHDGSYVLTARYADSMLAAILGADKTLSGAVVKYPGYPARADVAEDGNDTIIATSIQKGNKGFALRALRISGAKAALPKALVPIVTDDDNKESESDPDFLRDAKGQRWMSYVQRASGNGHLEIVPINADFQATGRPFSITEEDDKASDATIIEVGGGGLMVVFLRPKGNTIEVVTEELACEVVAK